MKSTKSVTEYAEQYGVSRTTIRRWKAEGVDLEDSAEVEIWKACRRSDGGSGMSAEMYAALLRKTNLECSRLELLLSQAKAKYISRDQVKKDVERLRVIIDSEVDAMAKRAVPLLAGLPEVDLYGILDDQIEQLKNNIRARVIAL